MIRNILSNLVLKERSATVFAASFAVGAYIAFSPYIGFHTLMAVVFAWMFSLNMVVVLAASNLINNPWTMIPVYSSGYIVGEWILGSWFGLNTFALNPTWIGWFNERIHHYTGMHGVAWWSFMLGGNLLGLVLAVMLYPIMKRVFVLLVSDKKITITQ